MTVLKEVAVSLGGKIVRDPTAWALILSNIGAAVYVFLHPPITSGLLGLYWLECVIVGLFNVLKMFLVPIKLGPAADEHPVGGFILRTLGRLFCSAFFLFHYGFFLVCCLALIGGIEGEEMKIRRLSSSQDLTQVHDLLMASLFLVAGHAISFVWNYVVKKEYRQRTMQDQMIKPYGRVFVMFFSLVIGGILVSSLRLPVLLMVVFVAIKIAADLYAHFSDHGVNRSVPETPVSYER